MSIEPWIKPSYILQEVSISFCLHFLFLFHIVILLCIWNVQDLTDFVLF